MTMEKPIALVDFRVGNGSVNSYGGEAVQVSVTLHDDGKESENPENVILEDLDSYWEDINDRLIISRMVSDSVIKGMVSAVEQEAAEKIAWKEQELARLKETLNLYHVGADESELSGSLIVQHEQGSAKHGSYSSLSNGLCDYDRIEEPLESLKNVAKEQLKNLRKEIDRIRGSSSIRRIGSGSEMVGLGGILLDKVSDIKWMDVDKTLDSLRTALDTLCRRVDDMVHLSKTSLCQWQQEKEFQGEIEDMVIMTCIQSLKQEFEERFWDQNARFYKNENLSWLEKIKEIPSLRQELEAISRLLSVPEIGHISSHGSMEIAEDYNNSKGTDHLHRKVSGNHVSLSTSLWEGNGKHDESIIAVPENLEYAQLRHMSKEELVNYFKTEMTKMKRNHEHKVHQITEEYFSLKREHLRERGSSLPLKKDKEFDTLRKKIPEVILKLDDILVENEELLTFSKNTESLGSLQDRLESLLSENRELRGMITDKKREVKRLTSQVSDTVEIMLQQSVSEANLEKKIGDLQCALEEARIEASISEDVYKCLLREVVDSRRSVCEQLDMESRIMREAYETILEEAAHNAGPSGICEFEDSDLESIIMQGLCGVIFREALKEAEEKLSDLNLKYINENELRVQLETEVLQKDEALHLVVAKKETLKEQTLFLSLLVEEKEKAAQEAAAALVKEKEQFDLVSVELSNLREETSGQRILICESSKETNDLKHSLAVASEHIELQKLEMRDLKYKLKMAMKDSREVNEERMRLLSDIQGRQNSIEAKEREHKRQMQTLIILAQCLFQALVDFEGRVMEVIKRNNIRLDNLSSQYGALIQKAKVFKATGLMYKQRLERRCSDLQKAEAEVDLLGDEVDALLSLLEKIYIALDHYSPILQHYPGIVEILKLVRRELIGESTKPA